MFGLSLKDVEFLRQAVKKEVEDSNKDAKEPLQKKWLKSHISYTRPSYSISKKVTYHYKGGSGLHQNTGRVVIRGCQSSFLRRKHRSSFLLPEFQQMLTIQRQSLQIDHSGRFGAFVQNATGLRVLLPCIPGSTVGMIHFFKKSELIGDLSKQCLYPEAQIRTIADWHFGFKLCLVQAMSSGLRLAFSRGSFITLILSRGNSSLIIAPSGASLMITNSALAVRRDIAYSSRTLYKPIDKLANCKGARLMRLRGKRPKVRGIAKNTCDHPHGGRSNGVLRPKTPWSKTVLKSSQYCYQNHHRDKSHKKNTFLKCLFKIKLNHFLGNQDQKKQCFFLVC